MKSAYLKNEIPLALVLYLMKKKNKAKKGFKFNFRTLKKSHTIMSLHFKFRNQREKTKLNVISPQNSNRNLKYIVLNRMQENSKLKKAYYHTKKLDVFD